MSHQTYLDYISSYFPTNEEFLAFQKALKKPLDKTISIISSRCSPDDALSELAEYGFTTSISDYNNLHYKLTRTWEQELLHPQSQVSNPPYNNNIALWKVPWHTLGHFYIQETAASLPSTCIDIPMDGHILDMCAAPWGKTIQLANKCKVIWSKALIRANEPDSKRLQVLESNITRCGMENVILTQHNGEHFGTIAPEVFDAILLDAPCSGEWTGFKSDFGTKFRDIHKIKQIAHLQYTLLESALHACKIWGQIMYSTCTINTIENEENIIKLMEQYGDYLEIEEINISWLSNGIIPSWMESRSKVNNQNEWQFRRLWPHIQHTGWFFMCKLRKINSLQNTNREQKNPFKTKSKYTVCNLDQLSQRLYNNFWIYIQQWYTFTQFQNNIYLTHESIINKLPFLNIYSPGLLVIKWEKEQDRRPVHSAGVVRQRSSANQLHITHEQLQKHLNQEDFLLNEHQKEYIHHGFIQLIYSSQWVWIGKIIWDNVKNKYSGIN